MKKWSSSLLGFACFLVFLPSLRAQAIPTATRYGSGLQVGAGLLRLNNDETFHLINYGVTAWADYDFRFVGIEAEAHFGGIKRADGLSQNTYLIGPRVAYRRHKATVYGKFLYGRGVISDNTRTPYPGFNPLIFNNIYAFGGGVEYKVAQHINIRLVDVEEQKFPDFFPHTLSPLALTFGASYVLH